MLAVAGAVFGKGCGPRAGLRERPAQPERAGVGGLELHENPVVSEQRRAAVTRREREMIRAPADPRVECHAQTRLRDPGKGRPVIGDEHTRLRAVHPLEPADLAGNLPRNAHLAAQERVRARRREGDAALIDDAADLFLQLHEHTSVRCGRAVAAHAELFLIIGLFQ